MADTNDDYISFDFSQQDEQSWNVRESRNQEEEEKEAAEEERSDFKALHPEDPPLEHAGKKRKAPFSPTSSAVSSAPSTPGPEAQTDEAVRSIYPWVREKPYYRVAGSTQPGRMLNAEVQDFIRYISPCREEHIMRQMVILRLEGLVQTLWPAATVKAFGSFHTRLYLPTGDIDMVVFNPTCRDIGGHQLHQLSVALRRHSVGKNIQVIARARVPLVKYVDSVTGINVDISFNGDSGLYTLDVSQNLLSILPGVRELVLLVKYFLSEKDMNAVFTGGIGSYGILLMVTSFLQRHPGVQTGKMDPRKNLGVLFMEFLELYGRDFPLAHMAIVVRDGGYYIPKNSLEYQRTRTQLGPGRMKDANNLSVIDPADPTNDVTSGSFGIYRVRDAFSGAYEVLQTTCFETYASLEEVRHKKWKQQEEGKEEEEEEEEEEDMMKDPKDIFSRSILARIFNVPFKIQKMRRTLMKVYLKQKLHSMLGLDASFGLDTTWEEEEEEEEDRDDDDSVEEDEEEEEEEEDEEGNKYDKRRAPSARSSQVPPPNNQVVYVVESSDEEAPWSNGTLASSGQKRGRRDQYQSSLRDRSSKGRPTRRGPSDSPEITERDDDLVNANVILG
ncbi:MAG: hypothetical protein DHS80DRAFT_29553 [Piptocephalis tieghemiana]|nr:MAG: hypothetical protein DHS80DRAFT_29553 [Piptocephalis tieghemiana]